MSAVEEKAGVVIPGMMLAPGKKGFYTSLRIDEIAVSSNVRRTFDEDKLAELAESIRQYGVLQPLVVRMIQDPTGQGRAPAYVLVAGERRLRAAKMAGLTEVPCRIVDITAKEAAEVQLLENLQREDLNPMEEAEGYLALIREHGYTQQEIAEKIGKKQPYVASRIGLLKLPQKVQQSITRGIVNVSAAEVMAKYATAAPEVVIKVAEKMKDRPIPVAKLREEIDNEVACKCEPLDNLYSWSSPKFDSTPCIQSCPKVLHLKTYGSTNERPYCSDVKCWEEKDKAAREELKRLALEAAGEGAVDLDTYSGNWSRLSDEDLKRCDENCQHRVKGVRTWGDGSKEEVQACLKPSCREERLERARKEADEARTRAQDEEIARLVNKCDFLGYAVAFGSLPKPLLVGLAVPLLKDSLRFHDQEFMKRFTKDIGWTGHELQHYNFDTIEMCRTLEQLPGPSLARLVLDIMISYRVRTFREHDRLLYMVGEPIPEKDQSADAAMDDTEDEGLYCPDDCDADCDNCDIHARLSEIPDDDEPMEKAGDDPVSHAADEPPAADPEIETPEAVPAPAEPEDPTWTAVVHAAYRTMGAPVGPCTPDKRLMDISEEWDVWASLSFAIALENCLGVKVPDEVAKSWETLGEAFDYVKKALVETEKERAS